MLEHRNAWGFLALFTGITLFMFFYGCHKTTIKRVPDEIFTVNVNFNSGGDSIMQPALFRDEKPLVQIDLSNGPAIHWSNYAKVPVDMSVLLPCLNLSDYGANPRNCIGPENWNMAVVSGINDQLRRNKRESLKSWLVVSSENTNGNKIDEIMADPEKFKTFLTKLLNKIEHKVDFIEFREKNNGNSDWTVNWKYRWKRGEMWEKLLAIREIITATGNDHIRVVLNMPADVSNRFWLPFLADLQVNKMAGGVAFLFTNPSGNINKMHRISARQDRLSVDEVPILLEYGSEDVSLIELTQSMIGAARSEAVGLVHWEKAPVGYNGKPDSTMMGLFNLNKLLSSTLGMDKGANQVLEDDFADNTFLIGKNGDGEFIMVFANKKRAKFHLKLHHLPREKLYHVDYVRGDFEGDGYRVFESKEIWHFDEVMDLTVDLPYNAVLGLKLTTVKMNNSSS